MSHDTRTRRSIRPPPGSESGFTIVELLIALLIVGLLAAIGILNMEGAVERTRVARAMAELRSIEKKLAIYELDYGYLPESLDEVGYGSLMDPWDSPYEYLRFFDPGGGNGNGGKNPPGQARKDKSLVPINSTFDLYSKGPDGKSVAPLTASASRDDIVRAGDGSFVGIAADF